MMRNRCSTSVSVREEVGSSKTMHLGIVGNRLGDLDHLPLGNRQGGHDGLGVDADLQRVKNLFGACGHDAFADHDAADLGVPAQPQVVLHRAGQGLVEFLVHHCHTVFQGFFGAFEIDWFAVQRDVAAVLVINAE